MKIALILWLANEELVSAHAVVYSAERMPIANRRNTLRGVAVELVLWKGQMVIAFLNATVICAGTVQCAS